MFYLSNPSCKKQIYKIIGFVVLNYLMAIPFFFYMIQTLDWKNFYPPYLTSLLVFFILILVFVLIFPSLNKIKMFLFSFLWVIASAILIETFVLFLNNAEDFDGVVTLFGNYTLFMPLWLIITLVEFLGGLLFLKNPVITLIKYQFSFKFLINFWGLSSVTLVVGTASLLIKALLPVLIISYLLTYTLQQINQKIEKKHFRFVSAFLCTSVFISVLASVISLILNQFGSESFVLNALYSFIAFSGGFAPITLLILIVNEKL